MGQLTSVISCVTHLTSIASLAPENRNENFQSKRTSLRFSALDACLLFALFIVWTAATLLTRSVVDFPLVDDWSYVGPLKQMHDTGTFSISSWTSPNFVSQLLFSIPFTLILSADYKTAHLITLIIGGFSAPIIFMNLRFLGASRYTSLLYSGSMTFNPIFYSLCATYMTDIYYTFFQILSALFISIAFFRPRKWAVAIGWLLGIFALLSRQVGAAIPIAFSIASLTTRRWSVRNLSVCTFFIASFFVVQHVFRTYLVSTGKISDQYGHQVDLVIASIYQPIPLVKHLSLFAQIVYLYLGFLMLPCSTFGFFALVSPLTKRQRWIAYTAAAALTVASLLTFVLQHKSVSYLRDTMAPWGVGWDLYEANYSHAYVQSLTVAGCLGGALLLCCVVMIGHEAIALWQEKSRDAERRAKLTVTVFFSSLMIVLLGPTSIVIPSMDRYFLPILQSSILLFGMSLSSQLNERIEKWSLCFGYLVLALFLLLSVVTTHDYLIARRVQWQALNDLIGSGVPSEDVDAGWVFNGYNEFGKYGNADQVNSWFKERDYAIGLTRQTGFEIVRTYSAAGWAPWTRTWTVKVMKSSS